MRLFLVHRALSLVGSFWWLLAWFLKLCIPEICYVGLKSILEGDVSDLQTEDMKSTEDCPPVDWALKLSFL